jgi:plastocyanin
MPDATATPLRRHGAVLLAIALLLSGCVSSAQTVPATPTVEAVVIDPATGNATIDIRLFHFPDVVEVPVGTTVTWNNRDGTRHSVTHGIPDEPATVFDSEFFTQGESFSLMFLEPGDYPYFCMRHNHMQGVIRVVEAAP